MAQTYNTAADRKVLLHDAPLNLRTFEMVLIDVNMLATKRVDFDAAHASVADVVGKEYAESAERVALRTQLIRRPLDAVDAGPKILQFFVVNPNHNALSERRNSGLLVEKVDGEDVPMFLLNVDEMWNIAHGDGFSTEVQPEAAVAAK